jgi:hypothetical protein
MNRLLVNFIDQAIEKQHAESFVGRKSDNIYLPKHGQVTGYEYIPRTIYFTYIGFDAIHEKLRVDHYFWPGGDPLGSDSNWPIIPLPPNGNVNSYLKTLITQLAQNAADNGHNPDPYAHNFNQIEWRRKSYVVFFFDDIKWTLHKFANNKEAVIFYDDKFGAPHTPNHTFYDGKDFDKITVTKQGGNIDGQAIALFNHLKKADGTDFVSSQDSEHYEFGMYFEINFVHQNQGSMTFIIDPGGTNQGPPLDP